MTVIAPEPTSTEADPLRRYAATKPARAKSEPKRRGPFAILRSVLFWSHLAMGTIGGVIIFIMSITGALLGFERQLVARFDGVAKAVPPSATAARLPLDTLFARSNVEPGGVATVVLKSDRTEPVSVRFRERDKAAQLVDPYTGATIAPAPRGKTAEFMSWLRGWHRWLGVTGENRPLARKFTGVCNIAFLLLVLTGVYIWWPKKLTPAAFRTALVFNPTLSGKPRDFNWHNSLGFWSAIPLAIVIATGVFISYSWPGQWMDRLWGSEKEKAAAIKAMNTPPAAEGAREGAPAAGAAAAGAAVAGARAEGPRGAGPGGAVPGGAGPGGAGPGGGEQRGGEQRGGGQRGEERREAPTPRVLASLDGMLANVQTARPEWTSITVTTAGPRDSVVQLAVAEGNTYRPDLKTQYFFNAESGVAVRTTNFDSLSTSRKIRGWTRFGHTGEIFGLTGQAIATFVSFVGAILVYTGLALAWRRMVAFIRRRRRSASVQTA